MSASSVPGVGKLPDVPLVNLATRYSAGYNGIRLEPPDKRQGAAKPPPMVSASNGPPDDGKKSTIYIIA